MRSLGSRLMVLWVLLLAAALAVGLVLVQLYRQSSAAQAGLSTAGMEQACAAIAENYAYYVAGWAGPRQGGDDPAYRRDLAVVVGLAMTGRVGLEGGVWLAPIAGASQAAINGQALANEPADDIRAAVASAAAAAILEDEPVVFDVADGRQGRACPLDGPVRGIVAWVASSDRADPGYGELRIGLGVLLALLVSTALWLTALLLGWSRRIRIIETALDGIEAATLPRLAATGERELDRIVAALNGAGMRLAEAQARAQSLSTRAATAERLAALGRVAAGVAHEIRNPIAAMRLRAENALAGPPDREAAALRAILDQVARLDRLSGELLTMTQPREPMPEPVDVAALLRACAEEHRSEALRIIVQAAPLRGLLDATLLRRVLDNLVQNALQHTPPGGTITLSCDVAGPWLRVSVADTGPGVAPALRATLFEPFVTGRPDGTGLGLAIARELAEAQGGTLVLAGPGAADALPGATFVLELPWRAS